MDYVFPSFGIRFIAVQDNVDTENRDSNAMEMMPIMNIFNEWHAANTSKKIKAVWRAKAAEGVFHGNKPSYGYIKGTDAKRTLLIDEDTAPVVIRIFEMYASGISPKKISEMLNEEGILSPGQYAFNKYGHKRKPEDRKIWCGTTIKTILDNIVYIGHLPQLMSSTVSYKNHKRFNKDQSEWTIVRNTHEPIISQELWDKVRARRASLSQGRKTKTGFVHPLSGFLFCADCGGKMKMNSTMNKDRTKYLYSFNCGEHLRFGKAICFSHSISAKVLEEIVLDDIRTMTQRIVLDEKAFREEFIRQNAELADQAVKTRKKELQIKQRRIEELTRMIQSVYEDNVSGKMPENICFGLIEKYSTEQNTLTAELEKLETKLSETANTMQSADDFIRDIKKYLNAPELTREMCYELLERVVVGGLPKITGKERTIDIVYKIDISSVLRYKFNK